MFIIVIFGWIGKKNIIKIVELLKSVLLNRNKIMFGVVEFVKKNFELLDFEFYVMILNRIEKF